MDRGLGFVAKSYAQGMGREAPSTSREEAASALHEALQQRLHAATHAALQLMNSIVLPAPWACILPCRPWCLRVSSAVSAHVA